MPISGNRGKDRDRMSIPVENVVVDTRTAQAQLEAIQRATELTARSVLTTSRKAFATLNILLGAFGAGIDASLEALTNSAFLFAESFLLFAESETLLGSPRAVLLFLTASVLFYRAIALQGERNAIVNQFDALTRVGMMWF